MILVRASAVVLAGVSPLVQGAGRRLATRLCAGLLMAPQAALASDTYGLGEAAALAFVYAALFGLLVLGCGVAMIRVRSWRPLMMLPLSIVFSGVLIFALVSVPPSWLMGIPALGLLVAAPLLALPLAYVVYRDLARRSGPEDTSPGG